MAEGKNKSVEKRKEDAKGNNPKPASDKGKGDVGSVGKEDWTFDGKKAYEKPSHTSPDVDSRRKKEEVDEITSERKKALAEDIAGDGDNDLPPSQRMQDQTPQEVEEESPPPPPPPDEPGESQSGGTPPPPDEPDESELDETPPPPEEPGEPESDETPPPPDEPDEPESDETPPPPDEPDESEGSPDTEGSTGPPVTGFPEGEVEKYEIRHGIPDMEGETAEKLRRRGDQLMGGAFPESGVSSDPINSKLVKDLKDDVEDFSDKLDGFSEELNDIDEEVSLLITRMDKLEKQGVDQEKMEEKLKELSALYDLLSTDISPFMDMEDILGDDHELEAEGEIEEGEEEEDEGESFSPQEKQTKEQGVEISDIERYDMEAMIDWIEFLYPKTGGNLEDALSYYQELGWIEESLKESILSYAEGMKTDTLEEEDKIIGEDGSVESSKGDWKLSSSDHKQSLRYIKAIKNNGNNNLEDTEIPSEDAEISSGSNSGRGES